MTYNYAGQGRTTLVCLRQDIDTQLATGKLLAPAEYLTWIEYFRSLAEEMELEYRRITGHSQSEQPIQNSIQAQEATA